MPRRETQTMEDFPQAHFKSSLKAPDMTRESLSEMYEFLEKTAASNEATSFDTSQERLVKELATLVKAQGKTSIAEDFETPYIHPMITIQKWVEELKLAVREALAQYSSVSE